MAKDHVANMAKTMSPRPAPPPLMTQRHGLVTVQAQKKTAIVKSITREEIDSFWRRKKMIEEEHLLAAQKAAARIRAKSLKEEDYRRFEQLLREIMDDNDLAEEEKERIVSDSKDELRIGIKDWWTKSKYAYLNQPAIKSMGETTGKHTYKYVPQKIYFSSCSPAQYQFHTATSFGVF